MKRLKESFYYTLRYSEAELKAKGMKPNIKEAIFRSFRSFLGMEATRKLLIPAAFRQMLLDLGAGGGLHNGEWSVVDGKNLIINPGSPQEEVEEAIRLNNRGLETYKKVVSAQMDMVARKSEKRWFLGFFLASMGLYFDGHSDLCDIIIAVFSVVGWPFQKN